MTAPASMDTPVALLLTDLVNSAALSECIGDEVMAGIWAAHDRVARDLLRRWNGREIDKTDGFLLVFAEAGDALGYVLDYHRALAQLALPGVDVEGTALKLSARAGLHVGLLTMRANPAADVALGAKPVEADGVSKPIAARVMSAALGGQTLLTKQAMQALLAKAPLAQRSVSHGHWHVKGLPAPIELFEVGEADAPFVPPPDSAKIYRVVRQGDFWLPLRELRHSLPAERDVFVGRREPLQQLAACFERGARLVSLLGIGGGGKTRLATRFGWGWMGDFPGGVWFCDLSPARTVEALLNAVAQGLQVPLGQEDPVVQLGHAIAGRGPCLVILDNFEQLARHAETTLGRWLDRAAQASFLVTTREVLGIAGEETLALAPLQASDAKKLFIHRATAAKRDFAPGPEDEAAIVTLVKLLDGLPLAIELAAARVRTLAPRALLARMSERFKLLASAGGRQDRQATLRAAFDWSWDLLPTAEKMALAQLTVFEGGFTLESAEAVIDLSGLADPPWTLDVVNALVDKSFVRTLGDERFDLLVSVQAYGDEHLRSEGRFAGSGPAALAAAHARHASWFASLGPQRATEKQCAELDNLVVACRRAVLAGDAGQAAGALDGAWAALSLHGPFKAGADLAKEVCAMPSLGGHAAAHAHAVLAAALEDSGQRERAAQHYEQALQHARAAFDLACEATVAVRLGGLHARAGQTDAARAEHMRALSLARELGDGALECAALNGLGTVDFEQGRMEQAQVHYQAALSIARRIGDSRWQASLLGNLGNLNANQGRMTEAAAHCEESLQALRALGDRQREGNVLSNLGMLSYLEGKLPEATAFLEQGLAVARELGHVRLMCIVLANLALVDDASGRLAEAVERYDAALNVARKIGDRRVEGQCQGHLGLAQARLGTFAVALTNLDEAQAILQAVGDPLSQGLLACQRSEFEWLTGAPAAAQQQHDLAAAFADVSGAGRESQLGRALDSLRQRIGTVAAL